MASRAMPHKGRFGGVNNGEHGTGAADVVTFFTSSSDLLIFDFAVDGIVTAIEADPFESEVTFWLEVRMFGIIAAERFRG